MGKVERMRIAFFEVKDWEEEYLKKRLNGHLLKFSNERLSLENAPQIRDSDAVSVFIYSKIDEQIIREIPNLKLTREFFISAAFSKFTCVR